MEKKYVDAFFNNGQLQLSSFSNFAKHMDEQRFDQDEGKTFLVHRTEANGGQSLVVEADFGHDAYVLCGSTLPSIDLMHEFRADSGIVIKDPLNFSKTIAFALKGFVHGFDGPCSYQSRRIVEQDLGWIDLGQIEDTDDISKFNPEVLANTLERLISPDVYFLKHHKFVPQTEWRFVWLTNNAVEDKLILTVPESRQYCTRWEDQGEVVAFDNNRK